ncbi:MAG: hypothetical protein BWX55_01209 [Deltaproteobacteria bacterium ADurb.Bin022]|nr:MAG: hypothetical protein BWX55_01209 [Deltaproteobacteria bacterium ADurb.Bin022]
MVATLLKPDMPSEGEMMPVRMRRTMMTIAVRSTRSFSEANSRAASRMIPNTINMSIVIGLSF